MDELLCFALKLVSLHYQTQLSMLSYDLERVVICFKISIFALSDTTEVGFLCGCRLL